MSYKYEIPKLFAIETVKREVQLEHKQGNGVHSIL